MISDLEYVERELRQAEEGMSYTLSSPAARTVRTILALPGVSSDGPTQRAILAAFEKLDGDLAEAYF